MKPSDFPSVADLCEAIRERMRTGDLPAGGRLIEAQLAFELSAGRALIREALRVLAGEGYVEFVPHRGARVRYLTVHERRECLALCEAIGGTIARCAAVAVKDETAGRSQCEALTESQQQLAALPSLPDGTSRFADAQFGFLGSVASIGGTQFAWSLFKATSIPLGPAIVTAADLPGFIQSTAMLTAAVLSGKAEIAEALMRDHLRDSMAAPDQLPAH